MTKSDELEQKIKEGEILLAQERMSGWTPLVGSLLITFYMGVNILRSEIYLILTFFALVYLGYNVWRVVGAQKNVKRLEAKIEEYRDEKAKFETKKEKKK